MKRLINIGGVGVGGDALISVQSMTKSDTRAWETVINDVWAPEEAGCEIVRCAVPKGALKWKT